MSQSPLEPKNIVVVGGGQAGFSFLEKIRSLLPEANVTLVADEPVLPYQRPPLSKKYMTGEVGRDSLIFRPEAWYVENRINVRLNRQVRAIDRDTRTLKLSDSETLQYDRLMLATGSSARRLPSEMGGNLQNVYAMRSLADADALAPRMVKGQKLVVVGGGYIGLEAASVAAKSGMDVTLVEMGERILQRVACAETSDFFRDLHAGYGVQIFESTGLTHLEGNARGDVVGVHLSDGRNLQADSVLVGIGIVPNDQLAALAGLEIDNGIAVNLHGQTSDPLIYAAGDCASFEFQGNRIRLESVQNAIDQAQHAARHAAGEVVEPYAPVPWFWSEQYDCMLQIAGLNTGYDQIVVRDGARDNSQSHWYFRDGQFVAVDAMGDPRAYLPGKKILELGKSITPEQAADPETDLKAIMKALMKVSR